MKGLLAATVALSAVLQGSLALWPQPRSFSNGSTPIKLSPDFSVSASFGSPPQDLLSAIALTQSYLKDDKLRRLVVGRGASDAASISSAKQLQSLSLSLNAEKSEVVESITKEAQKPLEQRDESYTLTVPSNGSPATLRANTTLGLFRGLTTFSQLWYYVNDQSYTLEAPIVIDDSPAFVRVFISSITLSTDW